MKTLSKEYQPVKSIESLVGQTVKRAKYVRGAFFFEFEDVVDMSHLIITARRNGALQEAAIPSAHEVQEILAFDDELAQEFIVDDLFDKASILAKENGMIAVMNNTTGVITLSPKKN